MIAVTGATGAVGGRTAARLTARDHAVRLVMRDASRAPELGAEVRETPGYGDGPAMRAALEGVQALFLVPGEEAPDRVAQHRTAIDAAVAAGVERIVYLSFVNPVPDATFTLARHHWATEEHIRSTGRPFTFLRMNLYLDFLPRMVGEDGAIAGPAGDGRFAGVSRDDVADVAAVVLAEDGHTGREYEITGPEAITMAEAAAQLGASYRDETIEQAWASRASYGAPDWQVEAWISTYTAIAAGELERVTDTVARLTGHEPVSLEQYLRTA